MTVESDWDDWLPRAVESATPDGLAIWYLGCNGFIVKSSGGTTVFIDPYLGTGDPPRTVRMVPVPFNPEDITECDAVLGTHEHTDHVHGPSQAPILAGTGADYYTTDSGHDVIREEAWLENYSVTDDQLHEVTEGDTLDIGDVTVHVEPANDPDAEHPVSYVFEHDSGTFFHGGDARPGEFEAIGERYDIDVGVLAFGTVGMIDDKETGEPTRTQWYNDENMIIEAANELQLDTLVPTHWDMWKGMTTEPTVLHNHANSFAYPSALSIVEIGDRYDLD
ncbi:MBL fold metallo-hydrolase [Haloarcula taiwanensis]|uniref:MBL fold metallo-hydrolase n=1 Tax=Haloarcula taiwanensis TaxID=1932004 RepID=A0A2H4ZXD3_9EURY|nr:MULTISPECIES: MBL fold metallo-hydrolase [Haloarcula]AUG47097.1 MBL fold metallo-hydrolase [Haloarcula taiwanensis]RLM33342.1 MBL fold metallo-hydrolase [Haloarcula sp. Atlit-120R]RLM42258.1 MBL fold metallo-hydrolase [Haloarcula sp. Atlit-47R]RLM95618.1 MBL fold metallo-hydrolase [Haloarcula sp. Atlit-7R]